MPEKMQRAGEVCEGCRERWEKQQKKPMTLKRLPNSTLNKHISVPVCEYCDGTTLAIAQANASN